MIHVTQQNTHLPLVFVNSPFSLFATFFSRFLISDCRVHFSFSAVFVHTTSRCGLQSVAFGEKRDKMLAALRKSQKAAADLLWEIFSPGAAVNAAELAALELEPRSVIPPASISAAVGTDEAGDADLLPKFLEAVIDAKG
jgi:hypothetical protein